MAKQRSTGRPDEIEAVYNELSRELWALFYAQCSDADRAYDALQESFTRFQEQNGEPIRNPRAWLLRVGRNWLRDVARRQRVAAKFVDHLETLPGKDEAAEDSFVREELHSQVRSGLSQLKQSDREVLVLRYSLNWSSQRIAEVLETTHSAIDMRLTRARKRMRDILERAGIRNERN